MISHRNVISNVLQVGGFESIDRKSQDQNGIPRIDVVLGLLPQSHIYGLVVICAAATYRGGESSLKGPCLC
jgi:acyl-CoA synthetase (AMP-forming)/AMP-acid ligase II